MKLLLLMATLTAIESKCIDGTTEDVSYLDSKYVLQSHVRMDCTITGYNEIPECSDEECPHIAASPLEGLYLDISAPDGKFYSMNGKTEAEQERVINEYIMNGELPDQEIPDAQANKWISVSGPGVWILNDKNFMLWVDAGNRLSTFSVQKGGNMKEAIERSCTFNEMIKNLFQKAGRPFMWNGHVGIGLTCPSFWGTGLKVGVLARLPNLSNQPTFNQMLKTRNLQKKDTDGLRVQIIYGIVSRLISGEFQEVVVTLKSLIQMEKGLENGQGFKDLLENFYISLKLP